MDENPNYWICALYCSRSSTICCPFDKIFLNLSPGPFHSANERNYLIKKLLWNISCWQWSEMGTVCRLPRGEAGFTVRKVGEDPRYLPNTIITPPNRDVLSYRLHASSANWKIHPMSFLYSKNSAFESRFAEPHNILWIRILLVTWMNPDLDPKTYCNIFSYKKNRSVKRYISVFIYWS